jgi:hypothetical protein
MRLTVIPNSGDSTGLVVSMRKSQLFSWLSKSRVMLHLLAALSLFLESLHPGSWLLQNRVVTVKPFSRRFKLKMCIIRRQLAFKSWCVDDVLY